MSLKKYKASSALGYCEYSIKKSDVKSELDPKLFRRGASEKTENP